MPEYRALRRRWMERERRLDIRMGVVLAHYFGAKGGKSHQPGSFYGHNLPAEEQSSEAMLAAMKAFTDRHNKQLAEKQKRKH